MGFTQEDSAISFLPLSHVTARHLDYAFLCHGALVAYCPKIDRLQEALQAVRPTIFLAVPRVYEKIRQSVESKAGASPVRRAFWVGRSALANAIARRSGEGRTPSSIPVEDRKQAGVRQGCRSVRGTGEDVQCRGSASRHGYGRLVCGRGHSHS